MLQRFHCAFRTPKPQRHFLHRKVSHKPQVDHLPLIVGKIAQMAAQFFAIEARCDFAIRTFAGAAPTLQRHGLSEAATAQHIDCPVACNPVEPGREGPSAIFIAIKAFKGAQKHFGLQIFGKIGVADPKVDVTVQRLRIAIIDLRECRMIAIARAFNQFTVGGRRIGIGRSVHGRASCASRVTAPSINPKAVYQATATTA
jgi:hypothetical protein